MTYVSFTEFRAGTLLFGLITFSGTFVFGIGGWLRSYPVMLTGRIIFG